MFYCYVARFVINDPWSFAMMWRWLPRFNNNCGETIIGQYCCLYFLHRK